MRRVVAATAAVVLGSTGLLGCSEETTDVLKPLPPSSTPPTSPSSASTSPEPAELTGDRLRIVYRVIGSGSATVVFVDGSAQQVVRRVTLPWRYTITRPPAELGGGKPMVGVSYGDGVQGMWSCRITVDGTETAFVRSDADGIGAACWDRVTRFLPTP